MSTFSEWSISEVQGQVMEYDSMGANKHTAPTLKQAAPAAPTQPKLTMSCKLLEFMEVDASRPQKTQKKKTNPALAAGGAAVQGKCFCCGEYRH